MSKPVTDDLFSFDGRRNRKSYIVATLLLAAVMVVVWILAVAFSYAMNSYGVMVVAGLATIPMAIMSWALGSQRCRDFGWTGWAILITLIPYVGWLFSIVIMFVPGTQGPNRYGPDPLAGSEAGSVAGMAGA